MDDDYEYTIITMADGRRVVSIDGQGHLPLKDFQPPGLGNEGTHDMGGTKHESETTKVTETTVTEKAAAFPTLDDEKTVTETTKSVEIKDDK